MPADANGWVQLLLGLLAVGTVIYLVPARGRVDRLRTDLDEARQEIHGLREALDFERGERDREKVKLNEMTQERSRMSADIELLRSALGAEQFIKAMESKLEASAAERHQQLLTVLTEIRDGLRRP